MTIISSERTAATVVDTAVAMGADYLLDRLHCAEPTALDWERTLDCGTMRVRIRVEVEPTGLTGEQVAAETVAGDENELLEVRAAARLVLAGGPGREAALEVLARSGPWPF
ncbi:hypothetical protein ACFU3O_01950 [Streptomyces antibioticus]|uniref:hypothetical protein n=1 Tax=Streptomyces antibioticus TaxID=1890 RepID=UPI0036B9CEA2